MKQVLISAMLLASIVSAATPRTAMAGCKSDCRDDYESSVDSCKSSHGDDPDVSDSLKSCIDSAKSDFDSCEDECDS